MDLEITAWTYDTPVPGGTYVGGLSFHKPSPVGTAHTSPLYTRETVEKAMRELVRRLREAEKDAARLDFLDRNKKFNMSWSVGIAPAGNLSMSSVVRLGKPVTSVRYAIDCAMEVSK